MVGGKPLAINGKNLLVGTDGITADKDFTWIYYAPLNGNKGVYRVKMEDLLSEGFSIDASNNLYLTAMESNSVAVILAKDKSVQNIVTDERLLWPDGVSYNAADGYMYVSAAQVHLGAIFNGGKNLAKAPYYIFRFKPLGKGVPFR